ncbi:phospholipase-like protein [Tanacetum coccineum]|uniref:Phospholipase-like protein n=1 Tax=Tanacetum coccineum TaxID=301880 RepID=A0ABQ4Y0F1_9ASTR
MGTADLWESTPTNFTMGGSMMDLTGYEVPRVLVTCRRRQIFNDENENDENVPLYYQINNDLSIPFGREEFCLVTGLRFGVQNWAEYDTKKRIPFRRRVFPSYLDGQPITGIDIENMIDDQSFAQLYDDDAVGLCCLGILQLVILGVESKRVVPDWMLRLANDRIAWDKYPWGSYVWPTLYSQIRNAIVKRWSPLYVDEPTNEDDSKKYSICGYTWAFKTWILESYRVTATTFFDRYNRYPRVAAWNKKKGRFLGPMAIRFFEGNMPAARLTPDDNEARSDWWISSKAYFDGLIGEVERVPFDLSRQNMYEIPSDIYREFNEQKIEIERNKEEVDKIKEEMRLFKEKMNDQPVRQENKEPIIADEHYGLSDFSQFHSMQGGPSSFQGHLNSSYFNMGTPPYFQTPMSSQPGPSVWRTQIPPQSATQYWQPGTSSQRSSYQSFGRVTSHMGWQNLQTTIETHDDVDANHQGKKANFSPLNLGGAFEDDNVEENNLTFLGSQFTGNFLMYENVDPSKDFLNAPHEIYLDCYMRGYIVPVSFWQQLVPHFCRPDMHRLPYDTPIGWLSGEVFMPIHVAGNHWATGVIHFPSDRFFVFDSMYNEQSKNLLSRLIECWTPVVNNILADRGCLNEARPGHNFQYSYNDGLGIDIHQQTNYSDCGIITCWLISRLCTDTKPIVRGNPQHFFERMRNEMCEDLYMCRCEDTRECGYD